VAAAWLAAALARGACGVVGKPDEAAHPATNFAPWQDLAEEYRLRPGDEIDVKLLYNPELSDRVVIAPDGRVNMSLVGSVVAEGQTASQFARDLEQRFAVELQRPDVTVIPRAFSSQRVFVGGEVGTPGVINLSGRMGVAEAVLAAGGLKVTGAFDSVVIVRRAPGGPPMLRNIDLERLLNTGDRTQDVPIRGGDMIFVPRKGVANANLWVDQYIRQILPFNNSAGFSGNYDLKTVPGTTP
jgi:protein involved in polysaccharide export with SLBB domain